MKKLLLSLTIITVSFSCYAQNRQKPRTIYDFKCNGPIVYGINAHAYSGEEISTGTTGQGPLNYAAKITMPPPISIGTTTYDLQSNGAPVTGRVYNSGNTIGAAWTFGNDPNPSWPERGTGVNYSFDNGVTWSPAPTARVENERRGFGTLDVLGSGEVIVSHGFTSTNQIPVACYYRATQGTGTWSMISSINGPDSLTTQDELLWPSMRTGGANNNSIHMVALTAPSANGGLPVPGYKNVDGLLLYNRSTDGGLTWDIQNYELPEMDSLHYVRVRANDYSIDVRGDVVAVVMCGAFDDWILWRSDDNGATWNKTVIYDFPFTRYNYDTDTTDVDHDGVADIVPTTDGTCAVVIDNNNLVHCFAGAVAVTQSMGGTANIGFDISTTNGILYWNENMGANPPVICAYAEDFDSSGLIENNGSTTYGFLDGAASMPTAGVDANNNIYVAYSAVMENTDDGNGVNYRNVYAAVSVNNGTTWEPPVNISDDPFGEAVLPCMAKNVEMPGCLHVEWQNDGVPGTTANLTTPAASPCEIFYKCVDPQADLGVGIKENISSVAVQVSVSPNPASDFIMVNFSINKVASAPLQISNVLGQQVYSSESKLNVGENRIRIDVKNFSAGVYMIHTSINGTSYTSEFVVK